MDSELTLAKTIKLNQNNEKRKEVPTYRETEKPKV